jgi:hypothetical protein
MLFLNSQEINDASDKKNNVGKPCSKKRVKIAVVAKYLARFHKTEINESNGGSNAESERSAGARSARCKWHPEEHHNNACKWECELEMIFH